jgi:hypothetical protein
MKRLLGALALACVLSGAAVAGEMPGVNSGSVTGGAPPAGSTSTPGGTTTAPGEMPGVNSAISSETDASLVTAVLLTILTLIGR